MTDTEAALLRAIGAQPDEDTPRLVYADYLDEDGSPSRAARAEFIRLSVRLARLKADHPDRDEVRNRVGGLLYHWDAIWQTDMPAGFTRLAFYDRGFPYRASVLASRARDTDDPRLLLISYLELTPDVTARELRAVLNWPIFGRLKQLLVRGIGLLGERGAGVLAGGRFPRLERLAVAGHGIGDRGLAALGTAPGFPRLQEIDLSYNGLSRAAIEAFHRSPLGSRLDRATDWGNETP